MTGKQPIYPPYEVFYIEAMLSLTKSAMASAERFEQTLARFREGGYQVDVEGTLDELQNILRQAGALSRYFWPSRKAYKGRGEYLREIFLVDDSSPLKSRVVRDRMEHFDEKLDDFFQEYQSRSISIMPNYFGPGPVFIEMPQDVFRAYYTDSCTFEILGEKVELQPLVQEIVRVHSQLSKSMDGGMRFHKS